MNFHGSFLRQFGDRSGNETRAPKFVFFGKADPLEKSGERGRVLCALLTSLAVSGASSWRALFIGAVIPLALFLTGDVKALSRAAAKLNFASLFVCALLPLTYPGRSVGFFSLDGLDAALMITFKLNLISVVTLRLLAPAGANLGGVLKSLGFPDKLSMMTVLTTRYIFLLGGRVAAMTRAVRLRAPELRGGRLCYAFACMLGTSLIHSSDRAERSALAMECRGGVNGFFQSRPKPWSVYDTVLCVFFALHACAVFIAL